MQAGTPRRSGPGKSNRIDEAARRARESLAAARRYAASASRALPRGGSLRGPRLRTSNERLVFVVGAPRSGTTFLARSIGSVPGFVDLDEVAPLKAAVPELAALAPDEAAPRIRRMLERVRWLGLVRGLRGVEQTPETAFVIAAALRAYPGARSVHIVRDGRDVACSLLERGWLNVERRGADDAGLPYGARARFWVEPERREEFERASNATRTAWAWRAYVTAARSAPAEYLLEVRYESLVADPSAAAEAIAVHLDTEPGPLAEALRAARDDSIGRWRRELAPEQLDDVDAEAGPLLRELGYPAS